MIMDSSTFSKFVFACSFLLCLGSSLTRAQIAGNSSIPGGQPRLEYLGIVANKRYYAGDVLVDWQEATFECRNFNMVAATIKSEDEMRFISQNMHLGPFWFGARDVGTSQMYRWSDSMNPPPPTAAPIDYFTGFYYSVNEGPMALVIDIVFGSHLFGVHSSKRAAKTLCELE